MARYKDDNRNQLKVIPVPLDRQILRGNLEYSLSYLIDHEFDLSVYDQRYRSDEGGRPDYAPRDLLKLILLACSKGITSSSRIERLCRENVTFMALSGDQQPDHGSVSDSVSVV